MTGKQKKIFAALCITLLAWALATSSVNTVQAAAYTGQEESMKLIDTIIGRYNLNYTGNTNHFADWNSNGTAYSTYVYHDVPGFTNSSTATLSPSQGADSIKYAFLVWETRASEGAADPVIFITPGGTRYPVYPTYAINDYRVSGDNSWALKSLFCMATDVTSIVQGAGYGSYSVCNIPMWDANDHWVQDPDGIWVTRGGESPASWQLIVVEEGEDFPVRAVTFSMGAEFHTQDFGGQLALGRGLRSRTSGTVTGQIFYGASASRAGAMTESITAYNGSGGYVGQVVSNVTNNAGLYRNGALVNRRDYDKGCIRMDLSDVTGIGNNASRFDLLVNNRSWCTYFLLGASVDIAYPDFVGEQTTTVNSAKSVTVTGSFTNVATVSDTGIYSGKMTVTLDSGLTPVSGTAVVNGTTSVAGTVNGHTVTFSGNELADMMNGSSISYTVECTTENSGKTRFDNSAGFHGYLRSDGINTGYWIDRMWTAHSNGIPKYTVTLQEGYGIASVSGAGDYSYGSRVDVGASLERGFHWKGWTGSYTTEQQDFSFTMGAGNVEMTAEGEPNTYTVVFDPNGGGETGHLEDIVTQYDATLELPDGAGYYVKYTLDGVNVTEDVLSGTIVLNAEGTVVELGDEPVEETDDMSDGIAAGMGEAGDSPDVAAPPEEAGYAEGSDTEQADSVPDEIAAGMSEAEAGPDKEPQADKKAYGSVYMGWGLEEMRTGWEPQWEPGTVTVAKLAEAAGVEDVNDAVITLYAIWDDSPWIHAVNLYYTLEQAQAGYITEAEILSHAEAFDREDGSPVGPGVHEDGSSFTIPDYLPEDFTQFLYAGNCTENLTVVDSAGSVYAKQIMVYVVDTSPVTVRPEGATRFITEYYYGQPYESGGLEDDSLWKTDPEYAAALMGAFENIRNDTPAAVYHFTREQVLAMQEYVAEHGVGSSLEPDALRGFYDQFMAPNQIHY